MDSGILIKRKRGEGGGPGEEEEMEKQDHENLNSPQRTFWPAHVLCLGMKHFCKLLFKNCWIWLYDSI